MGQVGRKVFNSLGSHPDGVPNGAFEWWHIIATGEHVSNLGFVWSLRPEVVQALLACGMSSTGIAGPDEVAVQSKYVEGAVRSVVVNAYERNPVARARCIEAHGAVCAVCGFNFKLVYGEAADGYIHVHHLRPLAALAQEYEVDPVNDLRPVCPNCHSVIHLANPPYTLEQVQAMLQSSNNV
jgi:predicted HNH restriction endonuclease